MKTLITTLLSLTLVTFSYGQQLDTTQRNSFAGSIKKAPEGQKKGSTPAYSRVYITGSQVRVKGKYIVDGYSVQVRYPGTNKVISAISGSEVLIDSTQIIGDEFETIEFKLGETQLMATDDYFFRAFGDVIDNIPEDFPEKVYVCKTDNLDCYGFVQLADGTLVFPYNGLLVYLRRI